MNRSLLGIALAFTLAPSAQASTTWICGLSEDLVRLECIADLATEAVDAPAPRARVNGTSFPLDPRRRYTVDLWSPPNEFENLKLLARATICYRSPGCEVIVVAPGIHGAAVARR